MRTWGEGSHLHTKERGLRGNQACWHLDLGHPAFSTVRESTSAVHALQSEALCYSSPSWRIQTHTALHDMEARLEVYNDQPQIHLFPKTVQVTWIRRKEPSIHICTGAQRNSLPVHLARDSWRKHDHALLETGRRSWMPTSGSSTGSSMPGLCSRQGVASRSESCLATFSLYSLGQAASLLSASVSLSIKWG